jgi:L-cysteine:1D-myo-inositol 2-amino-2-deoxy-alpha-D-glucopyranoside ligase
MKFYNTLTRQLDEFIPQKEKQVSLYVCGITPYDTTHLGHAFTYLSFDLLVRFLNFSGYRVTYTQNVTDINDRDNDILKRAKEQHVPWDKLGEYWTEKFLNDMSALNWIVPTYYLYASKEISHMISLIEKTIAHGVGYVANGGVYLDVEKVKDFGKLSRLNPEERLKMAKDFEEDVENKNKRHFLDITMWRPSAPDQPAHIPSFDSPWGKGRPGWHIECSAMSISSLNEQIDIHGGGKDLIFPHHDSEIAQSESATRKIPFAKYWMHTGTVYITGDKMSKSLGNLILVSDLLKKYSPNAIRWVLLSKRYREDWEYDEKEFENAEEVLKKLIKKLNKHNSDAENRNFKQQTIELLSNDLNSSELLKIFSELETLSLQEVQEIQEILHMMGFQL